MCNRQPRGSLAAARLSARRMLYGMRLMTCAALLVNSPLRAIEPSITLARFDDSLGVRLGDVEIARYVFRDQLVPRPYFAHLTTTTGRRVTRTHPPVQGTDAVDHPGIHTGLWLSFGDLSGQDYWRLKAHTEQTRLDIASSSDGQQATFTVENRYHSADEQRTLGHETCRYQIELLPVGYHLTLDSEFRPVEGELVFGDQEEMGLGLRLATPLAVDRQQGGRILDSAGRLNGAGIWGQSAAWCDYAGPAEGEWVGVTMAAHPDNFRPTRWHARDYGLLVANPFALKAFDAGEASRIVVPAGAALRLRFAVVVHATPTGADYNPASWLGEYAP